MTIIEECADTLFRLRSSQTFMPNRDEIGAKSLKVSTIPDDHGLIEIPLYAMPQLNSIFNDLPHDWNKVHNKEFYIPLVFHRNNCISPECKSAKPLIKTLWGSYGSDTSLWRRVCTGVTYYGKRGIILYDDFTPLFMFTMVLQYTPEIEEYVIKEIIGRVNPRVFTQDDIISKHVRAHLIRDTIAARELILEILALRSFSACMFRLPHSDDSVSNIPIKFIVEDMDKWLSEPTVMDATHNVEDINTYIKDNIETLSKMI